MCTFLERISGVNCSWREKNMERFRRKVLVCSASTHGDTANYTNDGILKIKMCIKECKNKISVTVHLLSLYSYLTKKVQKVRPRNKCHSGWNVNTGSLKRKPYRWTASRYKQTALSERDGERHTGGGGEMARKMKAHESSKQVNWLKSDCRACCHHNASRGIVQTSAGLGCAFRKLKPTFLPK